MKPGALTVVVLIACWLCTKAAAADIYERYDAHGTLEFSHRPRGPGWRRVVFPARLRTRSTRSKRAGARVDPVSLNPHIAEAARLYALPQDLLRAVIRVESDFHPRAVSSDGALGLMQLMPFTARRMGVTAPFDPRQNILGGARFLRIVANRFEGELTLALAAYNAGPGAVEKYGGVPPYPETQRYVGRVMTAYAALVRLR